ncbi:MAG: bifunctional (p)ppGpp synthetase/guanosine-3',5'-bis(diphosphate) 3'-pyrophosphohydrolase [Planctomycetaceae bacterium]|nr:bifunctional (p)ppGpp synthetase/guanosine-3',5'-bis(diphosphate) 3'-pyrophosphohydrolase [Planctomycetaceae bacterium]
MSDLVTRAADFAKAAHESINQRRKYSDQPYIVHPATVAEIVKSVTEDPVVLAAAWLHDVVEDTPVTLEEVRIEFGDEVARLVDDLTDVAQKSDGNRKQRLAIDRAHTATADPRAKTVKLADVIHNLSDILDAPRGFAFQYLEEKQQLLEALLDGDRHLLRRAQQVIDAAREQLSGKGAP